MDAAGGPPSPSPGAGGGSGGASLLAFPRLDNNAPLPHRVHYDDGGDGGDGGDDNGDDGPRPSGGSQHHHPVAPSTPAGQTDDARDGRHLASSPSPHSAWHASPPSTLRQRRRRRSTRAATFESLDECDGFNVAYSARPGWQPGSEPGFDPELPDGGHASMPTLSAPCEITVVDFSRGRVEKRHFANDGFVDFIARPKEPWAACRWININGLSWDVIQAVGNNKNLHRLALEDIMNIRNRTKADWYPNHAFIIMTLQKLVHLVDDDTDTDTDTDDGDDGDGTSDQDGGRRSSSDSSGSARSRRSWAWTRWLPWSSKARRRRRRRAEPPRACARSQPSQQGAEPTEAGAPAVAAAATAGARDRQEAAAATAPPDVEKDLPSPTPRDRRAGRRPPLLADGSTLEKTAMLRSLQQYHASGNDARTEFMERHSSLAPYNMAVSAEQVSIFLTNDNTVISLFEISAADVERPIVTRLCNPGTILRESCDASLLVQAIIDAVIDLALPLTAVYTDLLGDLELDVLTAPSIKQCRSLYVCISEINKMLRFLTPIDNLVNVLRDHRTHLTQDQAVRVLESPASGVIVTPMTHTYLGDVLDHCVIITEALQQLKQSSENLINLIFNTITAAQNESMTQLTTVTIIFLPLTFITGFFGQNFAEDLFPEIHNGICWACAVPTAVATILILMRDRIYAWFVRLYQRKRILSLRRRARSGRRKRRIRS